MSSNQVVSIPKKRSRIAATFYSIGRGIYFIFLGFFGLLEFIAVVGITFFSVGDLPRIKANMVIRIGLTLSAIFTGVILFDAIAHGFTWKSLTVLTIQLIRLCFFVGSYDATDEGTEKTTHNKEEEEKEEEEPSDEYKRFGRIHKWR